MDTETKSYRINQFNKLNLIPSEYEPKIKIIAPDSTQTFWLDITLDEAKQIIKLLIDEAK